MVPPKKIQGSSATQRHHAAPGINPKFSNPQLYSTRTSTLHDITSHSHEDPSGSPLPPPPQTIQPSETLFAGFGEIPTGKFMHQDLLPPRSHRPIDRPRSQCPTIAASSAHADRAMAHLDPSPLHARCEPSWVGDCSFQ